MANGRNKTRKGNSGRDEGGFIALPWAVVDSPAYQRLSMHARALLLEVARQYVRDNNGRLLLSRPYMEARGWKSRDMLNKAKSELLAGGFIHQTVQGHRPNKASWYAVTWQTLDRLPGYDAGAVETFVRSAYRKITPLKNAVLGPSHGPLGASIGPPHGPEAPRSGPPHGPMERVLGAFLGPPHGHHLEKPSAAVSEPAPAQTLTELFTRLTAVKGGHLWIKPRTTVAQPVGAVA
ncbi:MAG: hypothetical protein Q8S02_12370 [Hydrogenophaga sp.]|nr:hypothetical protein [Hydrogenophaga sp.]